MTSLRIDIDQASYDQLKALAVLDRRTPRMQAEWMLIEVLKEAAAARLPNVSEHRLGICGDE